MIITVFHITDKLPLCTMIYMYVCPAHAKCFCMLYPLRINAVKITLIALQFDDAKVSLSI